MIDRFENSTVLIGMEAFIWRAHPTSAVRAAVEGVASTAETDCPGRFATSRQSDHKQAKAFAQLTAFCWPLACGTSKPRSGSPGTELAGVHMVLIVSCAWPAIAAWLIPRAFTQRKLLQVLEIASPPPAKAAPNTVVIIPCRDEEANIGLCLCSLLKQNYPAERFALLVVDDHSTDATASIAKALAQNHSCISGLRSAPLPQHWTGKSHACWIGALAARPGAEWLCFFDAEMQAGPDLLASSAASVQSEQLDLLLLAPRQELGSFAERPIIPCGLYFLAFRQDLRKLQSTEQDDVTVTGQFVLVRRSAYVRVGCA
jgi:chlorobactene glucosyltransferase